MFGEATGRSNRKFDEFLPVHVGRRRYAPAHHGRARHVDAEATGALSATSTGALRSAIASAASTSSISRAPAPSAGGGVTHGSLSTPQPAKSGDIKAAVLAVHGAADPIAPKAERDAFEAEMTAAGARWALLTFGGVVHAFTDPQENNPGVAVYNEPATRHGYALAHGYIADAFAGKL